MMILRETKQLEDIEASVIAASWVRRIAKANAERRAAQEKSLMVVHDTCSVECLSYVSCRAIAAACALVAAEREGALRNKLIGNEGAHFIRQAQESKDCCQTQCGSD